MYFISLLNWYGLPTALTFMSCNCIVCLFGETFLEKTVHITLRVVLDGEDQRLFVCQSERLLLGHSAHLEPTWPSNNNDNRLIVIITLTQTAGKQLFVNAPTHTHTHTRTETGTERHTHSLTLAPSGHCRKKDWLGIPKIKTTTSL